MQKDDEETTPAVARPTTDGGGKARGRRLTRRAEALLGRTREAADSGLRAVKDRAREQDRVGEATHRALELASGGLGQGQQEKTKKPSPAVAELLKKEKIFFVMNSPDGWRSGDQDAPNMLAEQQSNSRPPAVAPSPVVKLGRRMVAVPSASETRRAVRSSLVAKATRTWQLSRIALFCP